MGIPGLFKTLIAKYNNTINCDTNYNANYLFLDYNCMIHYCKAIYMSQSNIDYAKISKMSKATLEKNLINNVIDYTRHIVNHAQPDTLIYIAIDGSVPFAKMHLQRERRFKSIIEDAHKRKLQKKYGLKEGDLWSSNNITPGTKFMDKLSIELKKAIKKGIFTGHTNNPIDVILSDSYVPGEGETKIFSYIRQNNLSINSKICIYGLDGDLVMLSIASQKNIQLIRETSESKIDNELYNDCEFIYFNINNLVTSLTAEYNLGDMDMNRFISDFILLTCLAGNDFVKKVYFLKFNPKKQEQDVWYILMNIYLNIYRSTNTHLVTMNTRNNKKLPVQINQPFFTQIINALSDKEQYALTGMQRFGINSHKDKVDNRISNNNENKSEYDKELEKFSHTPYYNPDNPYYDKYRPVFDELDLSNRVNNKKQYYKHFFGLDPTNVTQYNKYRKLISYHYIESIVWTINYYLADIISWSFYYKGRVAPFISDVKFNLQSMPNINTFFSFELDKPYKPLHQLMMVTPPQSKSILPTKYGSLMTDTKSPIKKYYPMNVELDVLSGLKYIYSHAILPHIDDKKIMMQLNKIDKILPNTDKKRNVIKETYEEFKL
jgi:5'-3' exonuclease